MLTMSIKARGGDRRLEKHQELEVESGGRRGVVCDGGISSAQLGAKSNDTVKHFAVGPKAGILN